MSIRDKIIETARTFLGTPYSTLDCSAFVRATFRKLGYELPRVSASQGKHLYDKGLGLKIAKSETKGDIEKKLKIGKLIFWGNDSYTSRWLRIHHVGIYSGNGKNIESSSSRGKVVERDIWESSSWQIVLIADMVPLLTNEEEEEMLNKDDKEAVYMYQRACLAAGYEMVKNGKVWPDMQTGENNGCDGIFGDWTKKVTEGIQEKHGLEKTGEVDFLTYGFVASDIDPADDTYIENLEKTRANDIKAFSEIEGIAKGRH